MKPRTAIIYARYSPRPNAKTPTQTIEVQTESCKAYAKAKGWTVGGVYADESVSGASQRRPEFSLAMQEAKDSKGVLLVYNLSRFARSLELTLRFEKDLRDNGCQLASVCESIDTTTAAGTLMFNIQSAMNQYFRAQLSEVTSAALRQKMANGEKAGGVPPYGYKHIGQHLVRCEEEQTIIERCRAFKEAGLNMVESAAKLNGEGFRTRAGLYWTRARARVVFDKLNPKD